MKITLEQAKEANETLEQFCSQNECKECKLEKKCERIFKIVDGFEKENYKIHQELTKHLLKSSKESKYFDYNIGSCRIGDEIEYSIIEGGKNLHNIQHRRQVFTWSETQDIKEYLENVNK